MRRGRRGSKRGVSGGTASAGTEPAWKSPKEVANELDEGEIRVGEDGTSQWKVVCLRTTGVHRWYRIFPKPFTSKAGHPPAPTNDPTTTVADDPDSDSFNPIVLGRGRGRGAPRGAGRGATTPTTAGRARGRGRRVGRGGGGGAAQLPKVDTSPPFQSMGETDAYRMAADILGRKQDCKWDQKSAMPPPPPPLLRAPPIARAPPKKAGVAKEKEKEKDGMEVEDAPSKPATAATTTPVGVGAAATNKNTGFQWSNFQDPLNIFANTHTHTQTTGQPAHSGYAKSFSAQTPYAPGFVERSSNDSLMSD